MYRQYTDNEIQMRGHGKITKIDKTQYTLDVQKLYR